MKKVIYLLLLFFWMTLIYTLSNQTGDISGGNSEGIIKSTLEIIYSIFNLPKDNISEVVQILHNPIRELAHAFEYFILGFLVFKNLENFNIKNKYVTTLLFCFICAIFDEVHQLFVSGRAFQMFDIIIDTLGLCLMLIFTKIYEKKKI